MILVYNKEAISWSLAHLNEASKKPTGRICVNL